MTTNRLESREDIGQAAGIDIIQNAFDMAKQREFNRALAARRAGRIQGVGPQGELFASVNTVGEAERLRLRLLQGAAPPRSRLTPEATLQAIAFKQQDRLDVEAADRSNILTSLFAGDVQTLFTQDVQIPEEESALDTFGTETLLGATA